MVLIPDMQTFVKSFVQLNGNLYESTACGKTCKFAKVTVGTDGKEIVCEHGCNLPAKWKESVLQAFATERIGLEDYSKRKQYKLMYEDEDGTLHSTGDSCYDIKIARKWLAEGSTPESHRKPKVVSRLVSEWKDDDCSSDLITVG